MKAKQIKMYSYGKNVCLVVYSFSFCERIIDEKYGNRLASWRCLGKIKARQIVR